MSPLLIISSLLHAAAQVGRLEILSDLLATTADPGRGFAEGVIEDLRPLLGWSLGVGARDGWLAIALGTVE
jgi:hypothetical protein